MKRKAKIFINGKYAGIFEELENGKQYLVKYADSYQGSPISLSLPINQQQFEFSNFPSCFEGLLPEGIQLQGLLKQRKLDRNDLFSQLIAVGQDMVGAITVEEVK